MVEEAAVAEAEEVVDGPVAETSVVGAGDPIDG